MRARARSCGAQGGRFARARAAPRISTASEPRARRSTCRPTRASSPTSRKELVLTVRAGTRAGRGRGRARRRAPDAALRAAAISARPRPSAARSPRTSGPRRPYAGARARLRARHAHRERQGRGPLVRRARDQERRGLRRLAPHGGRARHARARSPRSPSRCCRSPPREATLAFELRRGRARSMQANRWAGLPLPLSGDRVESGRLRVRLVGRRDRRCAAARAKLGGERSRRGRAITGATCASTACRSSRREARCGASRCRRRPSRSRSACAQLVEWGGGCAGCAGDARSARRARRARSAPAATRRSFAAATSQRRRLPSAEAARS